ncbi:MAG: hypothetical protein MR995_04420 [Fusobacterium mortiferum]|jgi:hypothetical protein|uniref:Uncharacterized protein n=1 Tax=Fusobacterium mortiferum ATCC 9817 TaxID=469616 RepID=A0ABM6TY25_FUSMR|nr:hypothetical protein [Fusobacterium mortiferum]AVQ19348.1 hypothetical protein C4N19_09700 [Fusobacterium mortiferum ATCC 9817]EEO36242.1 hypothetical protein FMAG_01804 [Fusobacterium mortiferum ATCC 9817]MCF2628536.1 hypothetical protein [Fusobacterium mortiferum]MCF2698593.1 hypothetical protein [Fusobacterium mortiferum]MCI7187369.1 hypothetical protein [Fusobacterium mortiferum]
MRKKILIGSILLSFSLFGQDIYQESVNKLEMTELSNTYSKEKIERSLKGYKKLKKEKLEELASKAVLVDLQAITVDDLNYSKNINLKLENYISNFKDISENSLGNISDKNIIERINRKYSTFKVIEKNSLIDSLNIALAKKLTTGYNIKIKSTYANFNPELSLSYGHNGIKHANQLIALMKSEGLDAKVQIEPKTSAYLHMPDWGEPATPNIVMEDGQIVITPLEYDLQFEFKDKADKMKFIQLIDKYAKKDEVDEENLIYDAWWQPFLQTEKIDGFEKLIVNIASEGEYEAYVLTLPEKSDALIKELAKNKNLKLKTKEVYVNPSFYRFMLGEYK